ncbi:hypothetical protein [Mycobacterium sp. 1164985.4]|uniref:hypothetical protein n=1 Tax=Mycobacterium sp. 1164985.4 TaxID=1834069 RepID=UPI0007FC3D4B|nr:hypothetical protein [Mycobacterium sp. 1164985.4]OBK81633.1 hypothetical protein A5650_25395 [Mycobacterium sp. 1164985.4]
MSSGLRTAVRVVIMFIAALVSLAIVGGLGVLAFGIGNSRVVNDRQTLPTAMRSLVVDTGDVPVTVLLVADDNATEPRVELGMLARVDTRLTITDVGDRSRVTLGDKGLGFLAFNGAGELKVILPPAVARGLSVTVNHRAGSLVADAELDQLVADIDGGAVTLGGSARMIDVNVSRGDIKASTRIGVTESFKANTEFGSISVDFSEVPRVTEATAHGNVTLGLPGPGPYRVRAQSEKPHGDTKVTVPETTDPKAPLVTVRSRSDDANVTELR